MRRREPHPDCAWSSGAVFELPPRTRRLDRAEPGRSVVGEQVVEVLCHVSGRPCVSRVRETLFASLDPPARAVEARREAGWGGLTVAVACAALAGFAADALTHSLLRAAVVGAVALLLGLSLLDGALRPRRGR